MNHFHMIWSHREFSCLCPSTILVTDLWWLFSECVRRIDYASKAELHPSSTWSIFYHQGLDKKDIMIPFPPGINMWFVSVCAIWSLQLVTNMPDQITWSVLKLKRNSDPYMLSNFYSKNAKSPWFKFLKYGSLLCIIVLCFSKLNIFGLLET